MNTYVPSAGFKPLRIHKVSFYQETLFELQKLDSFIKDTSKDWRWRITAPNGKIIGASSEGFESKQGCENNFKLLQTFFENLYNSLI
jgi:uncharacterized protein YegP (UPF0339 family)